MSGKGSAPRPFSVSNEEYSKRWDAIFQRDIKAEEDEKAFLEEAERIRKENAYRALDKMVEENQRLGLYDNTGTDKNEYYDILTTEEAIFKNNSGVV